MVSKIEHTLFESFSIGCCNFLRIGRVPTAVIVEAVGGVSFLPG